MGILKLLGAAGGLFVIVAACGNTEEFTTGGKPMAGSSGTGVGGGAGAAGQTDAGASGDITGANGGKGGKGGSGAQGGSGGKGGSGGNGTQGGSSGEGGNDTGGTRTTGGAGGGGATGPAGEGGEAGSPASPECTTVADCDTARGPSPCGAWQCNTSGTCEIDSPGCSDADGDGYGSGQSCACTGIDCDDSDPKLGSDGVRSCYSGPSGTLGVGACVAGTEICAAGVLGPCFGEVVPTGEACNGVDDDCDAQTDEGLGSFSCGVGACTNSVAACTGGVVGTCVPLTSSSATDGCNGFDDNCNGAIDENCGDCFGVDPNGDDAQAQSDNQTVPSGTPFQHIQAAIDWADTHRGVATKVCVAGGDHCPSTGTYAENLVMKNGISVIGNFESGGWTRCANSTRLTPMQPEGVLFPSSVQSTTNLDGFAIDRYNSSTTAAVTINGAVGALLSNVVIQNAPSVTNSYGVNVINGAYATIEKSRVDAGTGSAESIGVRSAGSRVNLKDNCNTFDANGRCNAGCGGSSPAIRGRSAQGPGVTYAVLLQDSPLSRIERTAMCANDADQGAAVRIVGDGGGIVIWANLVNAYGGAVDSHGIWMEDCGGGKPWIVDNYSLTANGDTASTRVDTIRAIGDCHPVVDSNRLIMGGGEGAASSPVAVHCAANSSGTPSACAVVGNLDIRGSAQGVPPVSTGVRCEGGSCVKVVDNTITGRGALTTYGVWLGATGALVDRNTIRGGCGATTVGVHAEDSYSRLQNNVISGYSATDCGSVSQAVTSSLGLEVLTAPGPNELDAHSNTIDAVGTAVGACTSAAVSLDRVPGGTGSVSSGIFRNNIFDVGTCANRFGFFERSANADPRILENNDFDPRGTPTAIYVDEGSGPLASAAEVDALGDMTVSGTLSVDPQFTTYPSNLSLVNGSPCIGAGTSAGAPGYDFIGATRSLTTPSIGAYEQ